MAITRLKRKDRKNKSRATNKISKIRYLNRKPVIKQVDIEKIKDEFTHKDETWTNPGPLVYSCSNSPLFG